MSTFVIVPGAWDTPAALRPIIEPLASDGHDVVIVDLPCENADATLHDYAEVVRAALPDDLADVVLIGYSFGGFTASTVAVEHPDMPVVFVAAWIPREGTSVLDLFAGGDPFEAGEEAGIAAFGGLILSAGPGLCALNIDMYVEAAEPAERDALRTYLEGRSGRKASPFSARGGAAICWHRAAAPTSTPSPTRWCHRPRSGSWQRRSARTSWRSTPITVSSTSSRSAWPSCWSPPPAEGFTRARKPSARTGLSGSWC